MEDSDSSDYSQTIFMSGPASLARVLALDQPATDLWQQEETRAMWQNQLRAPLEADLNTVNSSNASALRGTAKAAGFEGDTFEQLLHSSHPPLALLKLTKDFAKQTLDEAEDAQLKEIAAALYYTSYAAGIMRCAKRIGGMSSHDLKGGFEWAISRRWLDDKTKALISEARGSLRTDAKNK